MTHSKTFQANYSTHVYMYIYSHTFSVSVKELYKVHTVCLLINKHKMELTYLLQGLKLTLVRWPVASGFPVGPVESDLHWPGWPVKL